MFEIIKQDVSELISFFTHLNTFFVKNTFFYSTLQISRKNRYVAGSVIHYTGNVVVSASSSEFGIGRHLYRAYDTSSFINVALVLAHRCFESGIYCMIIDEELKNAGVKVSAFLKKIQEEGIILSEPRQYKPLTPWSLEVMQKPWKVHV
ncbi:large ribosomal subunit protein uL18m-like isoform X2 [Lycorma delicatula]|uniref:large ribosomal subunit protein uL18m-like isoform X2 n=1 Tax=Lycorma delicatula TaxID=130591 RepID=UPI003F517FB9